MSDDRALLHLLGEPPPERSDAARNRVAVLEAARRLIARDGIDAVTMDGVAAEAGVGKGTVFRRFGSRQGLMAALLDHSESDWQAAVISGPPPLGPGAEPMARLLAFGTARLEATLQNLDLIRHASGGPLGQSGPAHAFAVSHVRHLLELLGVRGDLPLLATYLMTPFDVRLLAQQTRVEGVPPERLSAAWADLAHRVVRG